MSNSEPSAIVLQGMACIGGLYTSFDSNGENGSVVVRPGFAAIHPNSANNVTLLFVSSIG